MNQTVRATCPLDCPDACSLHLTISREANLLLKVEGDANHPFTQGFACVKTYQYPARHHHPERPLFPLKRVGPKGEGTFERISWTQALHEISEKLKAVLNQFGGQAVLPYHYAGTMGLHQGEHPLAFFRAIGAAELDTTVCATAGSAGWEDAYGTPRYGVDPEDIPNSNFIILWGINSLHTNTHLTPLLKEAKHNGAKIVHIDPYENLTSRFADQHIKIRPGTDAALAYALAHVIFRDGLDDKEFLKEFAEGIEDFKTEALDWNPAKAELVTGVSAEIIENLAREFAAAKVSLVRTSYGLTRHPGGASMLRAAILLPALIGAWKYVGGGALLSTSGAYALNKKRLAGVNFLDQKHGGYFRPNANVRHVNMTTIGTALNQTQKPIRVMFVYNSNPMVIAPNTSLLEQGMKREDLLTVVLENAMTETAKYADYVLPATDFLEHPDFYSAYGHFYPSWNDAVLKPAGEAKSNTEIFAELARRLEINAPEIFWNAEELTGSLLESDDEWMKGVTLEQLKQNGYVRLNTPRPFLPFSKKFNTESGRIQFSPPPKVMVREASVSYPLTLMTPPAKHFLNSTYGNIDRLIDGESGEPLLLVNPSDAQKYSVEANQLVRIISETGETIRRVKITGAPIEGTVVLEGTWWERYAPDGKGANHLTSEALTDRGAGSTVHSNRVRLEPINR